MSELKATTVYDAYWKANSVGEGTGVLVYLKSEADKVIANRDYEIKNLKDSIGKLLKAKTEQIITEVMQNTLIYGEGFIRVEDAMKLIAELRHNKYKRCLAMARWCESENYTACWYHENSERCEWTEKWHKRWLKLAEKFKPNKEAE